MIIRIFKSGTSKGYAPVSYMMRLKDHDGSMRTVAPELLLGDPSLTIDLINMINRKYKYTSGLISFREEETPTADQMFQIIEDFRKTFLPGLDEDNFNDLWVIHSDKKNLELHFIVVSEELTTGKRLNISPPGIKKLEFFRTFTTVQNYKHGWKPVVGNPLNDFEYNQYLNILEEFIDYRRVFNLKTYLTKKTSFRRPRKVSQINVI